MAIFKRNKNRISQGGTGTRVGNAIRGLGGNVKSTVSNISRGSSPLTRATRTVASIAAPKATSAVRIVTSLAKPKQSSASAYRGTRGSIDGGVSVRTADYSSFNTPQFSPTGGVGSQSQGFTYTPSGWQKIAPKAPVQSLNGGLDVDGSVSESPYADSSSYSSGSDGNTVSKNALLGEVFGGSDYGDVGNIYRDYMSGADIVDTSSIRSRAIADVQDRVNALNQVYDSQLSRVRQEGLGRTGETTALLAARGLSGSARGGSIAEGTRQLNQDQMANVDYERNNALQQILSDANKAATEEVKAKTEARLSGASSLISFLQGQDQRKSGFVAAVAQNLLASGVNPQEMSPEELANLERIARKAGVSVNNIVAAYNDAAFNAAQEGDGFSLSSGQARYDSMGNLIASNLGAGGTGEVSQGAIALAQQIQSGQATLANVPSSMRAEVAQALNQLPNPKVQELDAVIEIINELESNQALGRILGPVDQGVGGVFGQAATAKNLYKQLKGVLALEGRSKLKGSGAISDFEFRVLKDAQSALGRNLNQVEFKKQLENIRGVLEKRKQVLGGSSTIADVSNDEVEQLRSEGYTDEEINSLINPNKVDGDTYSAVQIPKSSRLAYVNNNPGNLRFVGQKGAVKGENGFAKFKTPQEGYNALLNQIELDASRGLTLAQFINKYAPPNENDTRLYVSQVAKATGAGLNTPINNINTDTLGRVIAMKESSTRLS